MDIEIKFEGERIVPYMHGNEITMDVSPLIVAEKPPATDV